VLKTSATYEDGVLTAFELDLDPVVSVERLDSSLVFDLLTLGRGDHKSNMLVVLG
jgi:hypothetical protein